MTKSLVVFAVVLLSSPAWASPSTSKPDLQVSLTPPANVRVYQTGGYNIRVKNAGTKNAAAVQLVVQLPQTQTSPAVHVMGALGSFSAGCTRSGTRLTCNLGTINKKASKSVYFDLALPYSTAPIVISASATTTTTPADPTPDNNSLAYTAMPLTYAVTMNTLAPALNEHCTGQAWLSSYFECLLYPSSITSHETIFNDDATISFVGAPASYTGSWTYTPASNRLQFEYLDGPDVVAVFDGRGVSASCFEGKTTFPAGSTYVSMYRICFP